jgi:hypothetical protein
MFNQAGPGRKTLFRAALIAALAAALAGLFYYFTKRKPRHG